jgi:para-aminobenzoate synthetase component 1
MWSRPATQPNSSAAEFACVAMRATAWADPVEVASAFRDEAYAGVLLSGADGWSYVLRRPDRIGGDDPADLMGPAAPLANGPPFQGGVVGLASYEFSARLEPAAPQARGDWPDLILLRYPALLAFHAGQRRAYAIGRGPHRRAAAEQADVALSWLDEPRAAETPGPLAAEVAVATPDAAHAAAVAETVGRIETGEIFQANLARPWRGRLAAGRTPFDLFRRLARSSPAGYAAWLRLPGRALVSNSPERFPVGAAGSRRSVG